MAVDRGAGMRKRKISRVDVQVSVMVACIVIASFVCVYFFNYTISHEDMIYNLKERSESIYHYVDNDLDKSTFTDAHLTMENEAYVLMKEKLENVKTATNVMYLYTAKRTAEGEYIYLVDGLPQKSEDFRYPGDPIETEIIPEMQRAMKNELVMPDKIKKTTWGEIFVTYFPIHENNEVVGVLGIEFDASHQYRAYQIIKYGTPAIAIITCGIAMLLAGHFFRRISNPFYKDMANSDYLTNLKNRNAFMLDLENLQSSGKLKDVGIIVADLNDLKLINDTQGHQKGDQYICTMAAILATCGQEQHRIYRIGGDEFVMLMTQIDQIQLNQMMKLIKDTMEEQPISKGKLSASLGGALYDEKQDRKLSDTFTRADQTMYAEKRNSKISE